MYGGPDSIADQEPVRRGGAYNRQLKKLFDLRKFQAEGVGDPFEGDLATLLPIDPTIKRIIHVIVVVFVLLWLLQAFGLLGGLGSVRLR